MLACALAAASGCASATKTGYKVASATQTTVEQALGAWNDYLGVQQARVAAMTPEAAAIERVALQARERQVKAAYLKYQAAVSTVAATGAAYTRAVETGAGIDTVKARFDIATATAAAAFSDFLGLLQQFGVPVTR